MSTPAAESGPEDVNHRSFWMVSVRTRQEDFQEFSGPRPGTRRTSEDVTLRPLMALVSMLLHTAFICFHIIILSICL